MWDLLSNALSSATALALRAPGWNAFPQCGQDAVLVKQRRRQQGLRVRPIYYLFLVSGRGFMLIALDQCFQDWRAIKGWATVHFQHAAYNQLVSVNRGL